MRRMSQQKRLSVLLGLNVSMIIGLIIVGLAAHFLGVLAAGGDYIVDSAAILFGIVAVLVRDRVGKQSRATTYVALVNASALLIVTAFIIAAGVHRLLTRTPDIHGLPVLIVSAISTAVMLFGVLILGQGSGNEDLHMRSVLLDTLSDALTSAAVAVTGGIIYVTHGLSWLDSVVAVLIGLVIGFGAIRLLRDVIRALRSHTALEPADD